MLIKSCSQRKTELNFSLLIFFKYKTKYFTKDSGAYLKIYFKHDVFYIDN